MYDDINKKFGLLIAEKRKACGFSQEELAFRCGIHRTYIGAIERAEKNPTLTTIIKIADGLGLSVSELWAALKID